MAQDPRIVFEKCQDGAVLSFEESIYPKDAVFGAAYSLLDRCFVHIDREGTKLIVKLRAKPGIALDAEILAGEFESEALAQAWRREIVRENRGWIDEITSRAMSGAAGPPGLDDLLGDDLGDLEDAFDDPLGIAVSWEEKYGKGKTAKEGEADSNAAQKSAQEPALEAEAEPAEATVSEAAKLQAPGLEAGELDTTKPGSSLGK